MNYKEIDIWPLFAGLGLFLFGMYMLEEALKNLAGRTFKKIIARHTEKPIPAALYGALITGLLQSSSMVTLLVMSFTGAGIMGLRNGIGMIFGANIGTTITGWLVSLVGFKLDIQQLIMPFLAVGGLGIVFLRREKLRHISELVMGFSFMFLGLHYMKSNFGELAAGLDLSFMATMPMIAFFFAGLLLTAAIQSSSAAMMIFLSSVAAGIITYRHAAYLAVGADLGTTVTALLGTVGGNTIRRKVGWAQVVFNVASALMALLLIDVFLRLITDVADIKDPLIIPVMFHTMFNTVAVIVLLPFINVFITLLNRLVSDREVKIAASIALVDPTEPHAAIRALHNETIAFIQYAVRVNRQFFGAKEQENDEGVSYYNLKKYEAEITEFYLRVQGEHLDKTEAGQVNSLVTAVRNAALSVKDIKDIKHNVDDLEQATDDHLFNFYQEILKQQGLLYTEIETLLEHQGDATTTEPGHIKNIINASHLNESGTIMGIQKHAGKTHEMVPSLLNMVREIANSNEGLYRAMTYLWQVRDVK